MIPYWHYLVGLIPIIVLMVPHERRSRILLGTTSLVVLLWFWGGVSKGQAVERDFVRWTLQEMGDRIAAGERDAVCDVLTEYTRKAANQPFNGFEFRRFVDEGLSKGNAACAPAADRVAWRGATRCP